MKNLKYDVTCLECGHEYVAHETSDEFGNPLVEKTCNECPECGSEDLDSRLRLSVSRKKPDDPE